MQETNTDNLRIYFWERLDKLLTEKGKLKWDDRAEYLDVNKNTVRNWKNGKCLPEHSELVRIAHLLGCSTDYLIDETVTIKTASADVQTAVKTTGLSEKAVEVLHMCQDCGASDLLGTLSSLIVSDVQIYQRKDGKWYQQNGDIWEENNRPDMFAPTAFNVSGIVIQGAGLIGALRNNLEASVNYSKDKEVLEELTKEQPVQEEWRQLLKQDEKTDASRVIMENTGYKMMLICTTATAEEQEYHKILKEAYTEGRGGNGKDSGKDK